MSDELRLFVALGPGDIVGRVGRNSPVRQSIETSIAYSA